MYVSATDPWMPCMHVTSPYVLYTATTCTLVALRIADHEQSDYWLLHRAEHSDYRFMVNTVFVPFVLNRVTTGQATME